MPNYCENTLIVTGDPDEVTLFVKQQHTTQYESWNGEIVKADNVLDFLVVAPYPVNRDKEGDGWYDFCLNNWSVKWQPDVLYHEHMEDAGEAFYTFTTPWRDPEQWLMRVSRLYPKLTFSLTYFEPGMFFAGGYHMSGEYVERFYAEGDTLAELTMKKKVEDFTDQDWDDSMECVDCWLDNKMTEIKKSW